MANRRMTVRHFFAPVHVSHAHPYVFLFSSVGTWGFRFALECVSEVAACTLTAEAPSYATIMELDRKVREFPIPAEAAALLEDFKAPQDGDEPLPLSVSMTRFVLSHSREVSKYLVLI